MESKRYFGRELAMISVPYTKQQINRLFQNSDSWTIAFAQFEGQTSNLFPADPLLQFAELFSFIFSKVVAKDPLTSVMLMFMHGSSNERTAYVVNGEGHVVQTESASAQIVGL